MAKERPIQVGEILKAHGLKGEVKLKSFTADPLALGSYGPLMRDNGDQLVLVSLRPGPGALLAHFEGVNDRDSAEALHGAKLFVDRSVLPSPKDDEYYHADLIGLAARDASGAEIGRIAAIYDFGAGDVIEIVRAQSTPLLLPFTDDMVPEINVEAGFVRLGEAALEARG